MHNIEGESRPKEAVDGPKSGEIGEGMKNFSVHMFYAMYMQHQTSLFYLYHKYNIIIWWLINSVIESVDSIQVGMAGYAINIMYKKSERG